MVCGKKVCCRKKWVKKLDKKPRKLKKGLQLVKLSSGKVNYINMSTSEGYYDTEKNNYPFEQLQADLERMVNTDKELIDAINTLKCEMEEEYYQNNESCCDGRK